MNLNLKLNIKGQNFINALYLLDVCVKNKILQSQIKDNQTLIAVYCQQFEMNSKKYPEGWYLRNPHEIARELVYDEKGRKCLIDALKEKGIEFNREFLPDKQPSVCISVQTLLKEIGSNLTYTTIKTEDDYFDLETTFAGIVCCDGEECIILENNTEKDYIKLKSINGEEDTEFMLTHKEFDIAVYNQRNTYTYDVKITEWFSDYKCNCTGNELYFGYILYCNGIEVCKSYDSIENLSKYQNDPTARNTAGEKYVLDNINMITSKPLLNNTSSLMQTLYEYSRSSESGMVFVKKEEWNEWIINKEYTENDLQKLSWEITSLHLKNVIELHSNEAIITCYQDLITKFNIL